jgi:hypothetical protein
MSLPTLLRAAGDQEESTLGEPTSLSLSSAQTTSRGYIHAIKQFAEYSAKVKILERAETMGDVLHAPNRFGKRYASRVDRVTLCYDRFGMLFPGQSV